MNKLDSDQVINVSDEQELLFFKIGGVPLAVPFEYVKEVITLNQSILTLPNVPSHVSGIINLRGNVLAIINLNLLLSNTTSKEITFKHILILQHNDIEVGVQIDDIPETDHVAKTKTEKSKNFNNHPFKSVIVYEIVSNGICYGVLDVEKVLINEANH